MPLSTRAAGPVLRRALLVAAALAAVAVPASAQFAFRTADASARDTDYVDAVIRLDIENGPSAVVPALAYNSTLLLPLRQFLAMAEVRLEAFALRDSAVVMLEPGHVALRFRPAERLLTRGAVPLAYDTMDVVWWDGDLFVATEVLDRLLGLNTSVEWANLSAMVGRSGGLPVVQRERRERRRQMLYRPHPAPNALEIPLRQRAVDGAVMSWSFTAATSGPTDQLSLDLGFGAGLLGGSAELRPQLWSSTGMSGSELQFSWTRAWTGSHWVRQAGVGDVQSSGLRSRLLQGVTLTNAPFIRSSEFDVEPLVGDVPAGWEVELYDAGHLLAYADANALGAFRVPLQLRYGQNPFELVLYGPGGETVRQKRTIRVPFSRLPSGRLEYALAAGRCRLDPCDALMSADARYGLSSHVTLQGGWDAFFQGPQGSLWQPYAVVSAAPLPALALTGEAVANGHLRASLDYEPTTDLQVSTGYTSFAQKGALYGGTTGETGRAEASVFWRPGWMNDAFFFQGTGVRSSGPAMQRSVERLAATTRHGYVRYSLGVLVDDLTRSGASATRSFAFDASADAMLLGPWPWLKTASVQGQVALEPSRGFTALRASIGRRVSRALRADGGLGWFRGSGLTLELSVSTALPGPRFGARSRMSSQTGSSALTYAYGSLAWDPRSRMTRLGDGADLGRGGVSGVLFRDDNGNGVRDGAEPGIAGIPVHVGGWPAQTDADGRFVAWGLYPTEAVQIEVDSLSFSDPHLLLPATVLRVRPAPNAFGSIQVPVVVGAEISGFVVLGEEALGGVPVVLRDLNSGAEITITTFGDGGFYKAAVPPGEYEVTLPDALLDRLNAYAPPLSIFVPPGPGEKRYEDLQLRLQPRQ
jgi:hypothetical protein